MTNIKRRTEIQIETHEVTVIRTNRVQASVYCDHCHQNVPTFTSEQVSRWLRMIESGQVHLIEADGGTLVCRNSLEQNTAKKGEILWQE